MSNEFKIHTGAEIDLMIQQLPHNSRLAVRVKELLAERNSYKQAAEQMAEALNKISRKCYIPDPHRSIQEVIGRLQNSGLVASKALAQWEKMKP